MTHNKQTTDKIRDWEKEFMDKFWEVKKREIRNKFGGENLTWGWKIGVMPDVISFIDSLLHQSRLEMVDEIEYKLNTLDDNGKLDSFYIREALEDVKKLIVNK